MSIKYIAYRQADNGTFPDWVFPIAGFIVQLPIAFMETFLFVTPTYFMVCGAKFVYISMLFNFT